MEEIQTRELGENKPKKAQKKGEYYTNRLRIGCSDAQLTRWAELAVKAGFRHSAQKLFKINKRTGEKAQVSVKDIAKFIRDVVIPYYERGEEDRKRIAADALQRKLAAEADLVRSGYKV